MRRLRTRLYTAGLEATPERLGAILGAEPAEVIEMTGRLDSRELSLDAPVNEDGTGAFIAQVSAANAPADALAMERQSEAIVRQERDRFAATLAGRRRDVFDARWLADEAPTLQALGERYGVTRERMRQIERALLDELGRRLAPRLALPRARAALQRAQSVRP